MSILEKINTVSEKPPTVKMCLYGPPGAGKTVLAASAPSPLFVDVEHGTRSLLNHPEFANVPILPVTSWADVEDLFWAMREGTDPFLNSIETIVIDSITELQKRQMDELLKKAAEKDRGRNPYLPFQQDYKENTEILRRLLVNMRDLDKNLIITAHAVEEKDESDGKIYLRPAVTPKLASTIEGIMDVLGFLSVEVNKEGQAKRHLQVHPIGRIRAKCRIGGLDPILENPSFGMLLKANAADAPALETGE